MNDWMIDILDLIGLVIACVLIFAGVQLVFGG